MSVSVYELHVKMYLFSQIVLSGHASLVLFSAGYRGRGSSWFVPVPGFHFIAPGVIEIKPRRGFPCHLRIMLKMFFLVNSVGPCAFILSAHA